MQDRKSKVIELLKSYPAIKKKIALLQYECRHPARVTEREVIEGMTLAHPIGDYIQQTGYISDKTMRIAMQFQDIKDRLNHETFSEITKELLELEDQAQRLEFYVSQLDARHAQVIQKYYFEQKSWRELQAELHMSSRTLIKYRDEGVETLAGMHEYLEQLKKEGGQA